MSSRFTSKSLRACAALVLICILSYGTYFKDYQNPPQFFWDENYHIASAQKYLNGVFFMEPHPPLGKQLIALGEWLLDENPRDNQFLNTDHAKSPPAGFSFAGYRFFSALLGWLTAPIVFLIMLRLTRHVLWAALLSSLYVFDTALILQARGAMLEGIQLFFVALTLWCYLQVVRRHHEGTRTLWTIALCVAFGLVMAVKINGLILAPLLLLPAYVHRHELGRALLRLTLGSVAGLIVYLLPWYIHFSLGTSIRSDLPDNGYYQASPEYKEILARGTSAALTSFPIMLRDSFRFVAHYQRGVPKLNLCKSDENGSPAWWWPLGARSINYRWERKNDRVRYLFLQSNPAVWGTALLGVLGTFALLFAALISRKRMRLRQPRLLILTAGLWLSYMAIMISLPRVMYLYHYFIPLLFSFLMTALVFMELRALGPLALTRVRKTLLLVLMNVAILAGYLVYRPFAYGLPLSDSEVDSRALIGLWDLHCEGCPRTNALAEPCGGDKSIHRPQVFLGSLQAEGVVQDWGVPRMNRALEDELIQVAGTRYNRGIGVHAFSSLRFAPRKKYRAFSGEVGIPDYVTTKSGPQAAVIFEIFVDGQLSWESGVVRAGDKSVPFNVSLIGVDRLELVVRPVSDEITNNHALWLNPTVE